MQLICLEYSVLLSLLNTICNFLEYTNILSKFEWKYLLYENRNIEFLSSFFIANKWINFLVFLFALSFKLVNALFADELKDINIE